jgi:hypothetical protein
MRLGHGVGCPEAVAHVYSGAPRTPTEYPYDRNGHALKQAENGHSERMSIPVISRSFIYSE